VISIPNQPGHTSGKEERMSRIEERLGEMGVTLPNLPTPIANYLPAKRAGNLVFTAGQVSAAEGRAYKSKLSATLSRDLSDVQAKEARNYARTGGLYA
jgi:enamine deaminase RidA (YjgF/YER057c/UK114 family)